MSSCASQAVSIGKEAGTWPRPTGAWGAFATSYSKAHDGVFSNCDFTTEMPTTVTAGYAAWDSSISAWSSSILSEVAQASATCVGVAPPALAVLYPQGCDVSNVKRYIEVRVPEPEVGDPEPQLGHISPDNPAYGTPGVGLLDRRQIQVTKGDAPEQWSGDIGRREEFNDGSDTIVDDNGRFVERQIVEEPGWNDELAEPPTRRGSSAAAKAGKGVAKVIHHVADDAEGSGSRRFLSMGAAVIAVAAFAIAL